MRSGVELSPERKCDPARNVFGVYELKESIRRAVRERRLLLPPRERASLGARIAARLFDLPLFASSTDVALYAPVRGEVPTEAVFARVVAEGKRAYYPSVIDGGLVFRRVHSLAELVPGRFGVPAPPDSAPAIPVADLDLVVVPGVAFDAAGRRIGYGGGYYDAVLAAVPRPRRVGLAYEFQLMERLPSAEGDVEVGYVVTEERTIRCRGGRD